MYYRGEWVRFRYELFRQKRSYQCKNITKKSNKIKSKISYQVYDFAYLNAHT